MDIRVKTGKSGNVYYKSLILWIKSSSRKLLFSNQLYSSSDRKNFGNDVQSLSELPVSEVDFDVAQSKEKHLKSTFMLMSANKNVPSNKQDLPSLLSIEKRVITVPKVPSLLPSIL